MDIDLLGNFTGVILGGVFALAGVYIQGRFQRRDLLLQGKWSRRERYYMSLLTSLSTLMVALEDQVECYLEPRSEHDQSISRSAHFRYLSEQASQSLREVRVHIGPASLIIGEEAQSALEHLVREYWHASQDSADTAGYVQTVLALARKALAAVRTSAERDLALPYTHI